MRADWPTGARRCVPHYLAQLLPGEEARTWATMGMAPHSLSSPDGLWKQLNIVRQLNCSGHDLDCYQVGSLDFDFLVEIKLGFPPNPQKVKLFDGGSTATQRWACSHSLSSGLETFLGGQF